MMTECVLRVPRAGHVNHEAGKVCRQAAHLFIPDLSVFCKTMQENTCGTLAVKTIGGTVRKSFGCCHNYGGLTSFGR